MAVLLEDLIESLRREVTSPGEEETTYPEATDDAFLGYLRDAFWELWIESGLLSDFTEVEGEVTPVEEGSEEELDRGLQQLIVLWAGIRIIRNDLKNDSTLFRAKAGPVEFEEQKSATVHKSILEDLMARRNYILGQLAEVGQITDYYIDAVMERDSNLGYGLSVWWE